MSASPTAQCTDCTTVDGVAYPVQGTTIPEGAQEITDLNDLPSNGISSKLKRTLPTPDDWEVVGVKDDYAYSEFFKAQLASDDKTNVPHSKLGTGGSSSAVLREFDGQSRLTMTVQGLFGCTSAIIVSRKAVYISHCKILMSDDRCPLSLFGILTSYHSI